MEEFLFFPLGIPYDLHYRNSSTAYPVGPHTHNGCEIYFTLTELPDVLLGDQVFAVPAGTLIELYASTLHFAPCSAAPGRGFKVLVVLPRGTNLAKPEIVPQNDEDRLLWARNKWLLAHAESAQAARGAAVRLRGENLDLAADLCK